MEDFLNMYENIKAFSGIMEGLKANSQNEAPPSSDGINLVIKFMEAQEMANQYSNLAEGIKNAAGNDWQKTVLQSIRPNMSPDKKYMIDILIKCIEICELRRKIEIETGGQNDRL